MNTGTLLFADGRTAAYYCGKCGRISTAAAFICNSSDAHKAAAKVADDCCRPRHCNCGVEIDKHWTACSTCRIASKLRKAKRIGHDYDGPVYSEDTEGHDLSGEGYWPSLNELLDLPDDELPVYCHPCTQEPFELDAEGILCSALSEMHEGAEVDHAKAFYDFVDEWNKKQTCVSWFPDYGRVIVFDDEAFADLCKMEKASQ